MSHIQKPFKEIVKKLVSLKDASELMINLAYSSLLLNSRELANEVQALEERIEDLHTEFELLVLAECARSKESQEFLGLIRIGAVTGKIADAAAEISGVVLSGLEPHPVLKQVIAEAEETVVQGKISEKSVLVGTKLKDAKIPEETGMRVLVIRRGTKWVRPQPETLLKAHDVLIAAGYAEGEEDFLQLTSAVYK